MTNAAATVESLINLAAKNSGASAHEAVLAAEQAARLTRKHGLGGFVVAKTRRVLRQAECRLARCA